MNNQVITLDGKQYMQVEQLGCRNCVFKDDRKNCHAARRFIPCSSADRSDNKSMQWREFDLRIAVKQIKR